MWIRYKGPPDEERSPSDCVVTAAPRQLRIRRLARPNSLATKPLHQQKLQHRVWHQLGVAKVRSRDLVDGEAIEDKGLQDTMDSCFLGVEVWATSFAKAETTARDPLPRMPETPGSDFTIYVQVPRNVLDEWLARTHSNTRKNAVGREAAVAEESRRGRYPHLDRRLQAQG